MLSHPHLFPPPQLNGSPAHSLAPSSAARSSCERKGRAAAAHMLGMKTQLPRLRRAFPPLAHGPPRLHPHTLPSAPSPVRPRGCPAYSAPLRRLPQSALPPTSHCVERAESLSSLNSASLSAPRRPTLRGGLRLPAFIFEGGTSQMCGVGLRFGQPKTRNPLMAETLGLSGYKLLISQKCPAVLIHPKALIV